jgi:hypothetical protein
MNNAKMLPSQGSAAEKPAMESFSSQANIPGLLMNQRISSGVTLLGSRNLFSRTKALISVMRGISLSVALRSTETHSPGF